MNELLTQDKATVLTIGSRGSKLALWQANHVKDRLAALGHPCRIEVFQTSGDRFQSGPVKEIGNKGLFTKELEDALLDERIDLAVHSLKDMPADLPAGLHVVATPEREDPRDAIIGHALAGLPAGARIGTGSIRRVAQLRALRPDLDIQPVRGNVDTRLRKLDEGQFEAIVLAAAGLRRLGWDSRIAETLPPHVMCPAPGQGALAIETRMDGGPGDTACLLLNHAVTNAAIRAERALLRILGGNCQVPIGAYAEVDGPGSLLLKALVISPDGRQVVRTESTGSQETPEELGQACGEFLLENGAAEILEDVYGT